MLVTVHLCLLVFYVLQCCYNQPDHLVMMELTMFTQGDYLAIGLCEMFTSDALIILHFELSVNAYWVTIGWLFFHKINNLPKSFNILLLTDETLFIYTKVAGHLQTLYKKPFSLLTGSLVNSKECSLKNASNAICEDSTPTTEWPLSASLRHIKSFN